jgi:hypothetical protein
MKIEPLIVVTCVLSNFSGLCLGLAVATDDPARQLMIVSAGMVLMVLSALGAAGILWVHETKLDTH